MQGTNAEIPRLFPSLFLVVFSPGFRTTSELALMRCPETGNNCGGNRFNRRFPPQKFHFTIIKLLLRPQKASVRNSFRIGSLSPGFLRFPGVLALLPCEADRKAYGVEKSRHHDACEEANRRIGIDCAKATDYSTEERCGIAE